MSDPKTFETAALGNIVALGELYNANASQFLGAQIYTQESIQDTLISISRTPPYSDVTLSTTNTFQDKANLLDLSAELTIGILSGTITVAGSASYLRDVKSTTTHQAWIMALKMLGREDRIEAGNPDLKVIWKNMESYQNATHYVSAIRYGGNLVVRMLEQSAKLSEDEKISGHLKAELNNLKGAISLSGSIDLDVIKKFAKLDGKFDLQMYGDFVPSRLPVEAKDVIELFPEAVTSISAAGVPVSVILQPIPTALRQTSTLVNALNEEIVNSLIEAYASVEDLYSRFIMLSEESDLQSDIIPYLDGSIADAFEDFLDDRSSVRQKLKKYLSDALVGKPSDPTDCFNSARALLEKNYVDPDDDTTTPPDYPHSLAGLEGAFYKFDSLRYAVASLNRNVELRSMQTISNKLTKEKKAFLCLLWSISITDVPVFASLLASACTDFDPAMVNVLYVEDVTDVDDDNLPRGSAIDTTLAEGCGLFAYAVQERVIDWTRITWDELHEAETAIKKTPLNFSLKEVGTDSADVSTSLSLENYRPNKSFSVIITVKNDSPSRIAPLAVGSAGHVYTSPQFCLTYQCDQTSQKIFIFDSRRDEYLAIDLSAGDIKRGEKFRYALVQDVATMAWNAYIYQPQDWQFGDAKGPKKIKQRLAIPKDFVWADTDKSMVAVGSGSASTPLIDASDWQGMLMDLQAFPRVLTEEEIFLDPVFST